MIIRKYKISPAGRYDKVSLRHHTSRMKISSFEELEFFKSGAILNITTHILYEWLKLIFCSEYYTKPAMKKTNPADHNIYKGMALIADPIHQYILFTVPKDKSAKETT